MKPEDFRILGHMAYAICNAPLQTFPFPHIYVRNVFPDDFYNQLLDNLPDDGDYTKGAASYKGRRFAEADGDIFRALNHPLWAKIACTPFHRHIEERGTQSFGPELRLVRDSKNYSIGPHTDAPWKVLSYLFYLPRDVSLFEFGTSIYMPKDGTFRCKGGPHHPFDNFQRIYTAPFVPNSLFAFFKTDYSFHGVDPIPVQCQRDVLLWNLYDTDMRHGKAPG